MTNNDIQFLGSKDVAKALGCSLPLARQIMLQYGFPLIKVGRSLKVEKQAFLDWTRNQNR